MQYLLQKLKGLESLGFTDPNMDPESESILRKWIDGVQTGQSLSNAGCHDQSPQGEASIQEARDEDATKKSQANKANELTGIRMDVNSAAEDGQTALHVAVGNGHLEMVRILLERGAKVNKKDAGGWTPKALAEQEGNKSIYDLLLGYENRMLLDEHKIDFSGSEAADCRTSQGLHTKTGPLNVSNCHFKKASKNSNSGSIYPSNKDVMKLTKRRVTIHKQCQNASTSQGQLGKLIILPDSLEELLRIAGKLCLTSKKFLKIILKFQSHNHY